MPIKDLEQSSWLNGPNASYVESFYESWLKDPASVSEQWRNYFGQMLMEDAGDISREVLHSEIVTSLANRPHGAVVCDVSRQDLEIAGKQVFVQQLIAAYRVLGTRRAQLDPLKRHEAPVIPELDPLFYGLTDADLDTEFHITNTFFGANKMPLRTLLTALRETYCSSIGAEFMYISDPVQKRWWQEKLERSRSRPMYTAERRAQLDPLKRHEAPVIPELDPLFYGLTDADLDTEFHITNTFFGANKMPLRTLLTALRETYCSSIGAEFMYISDPVQKRWWQEKLERSRSRPMYTAERRRKILEGLTAAEGLERFLHTRYVGQKRFSLEGGESFITAMQTVVERDPEH